MTTTTTSTPTPTPTTMATTAAGRLRWTVADTLAMTGRNLAHAVRSPDEVVLGLTVPLMLVLVFGYVFGNAIEVPDGGSYREHLVPGLFAMTMLYGIGATATGTANDTRRNVLDRFRSTPMARSALVTGRSLADMLRATLEVVVVVACGLLLGWRWHDGPVNLVLALALLLLLRFALTWLGIYLGLSFSDPGLIVWPLAFPLTAVSNTFVAPEQMPSWLGTIADWNPLSATVAALRDLFGTSDVGDAASSTASWPVENATLLAMAWPVALLLVFVPLSVRRYRNLSR